LPARWKKRRRHGLCHRVARARHVAARAADPGGEPGESHPQRADDRVAPPRRRLLRVLRGRFPRATIPAMTRHFEARDVAWLALAMTLAGALFWISSRYFPDQLGYDMYHPWGIAAVRSDVPRPADPYADTGRYAEAMSAFARASKSPKAWLAEN